ncbi:hypothetical protein Tco_0777065 [Tanacetum coccineum]
MEQILPEGSSLADEAIRFGIPLQREEVAGANTFGCLLAQRIDQEEEELTEQRRNEKLKYNLRLNTIHWKLGLD